MPSLSAELGIVRRARRPPGWIAPGPAPGAEPAIELVPRAGEDLCYLSGDWRIFQRLDGHRWSLDDLVTAWVAAETMRTCPPQWIADLGCGIGSVLLMMAWRFGEARLVGVEAQEVSVDLARRSIAWNGVGDRCEVRLGDVRDPGVLAEGALFDLVTGTPPYLPPGTAHESRRLQWGPCHFEHRGGVEDYCHAAARLLSVGGRFVTCAGAGQRLRLERGAADAGLVPLRRLDVIPRQGKAALFSVHVLGRSVDGIGPASPVAEPALVVRDAGGRRSEAFLTLRRDMGLPP